MSDIARQDWEEEQWRQAQWPTFDQRFAPVVPSRQDAFASARLPYMDQYKFNDNPDQTWRDYDKAVKDEAAFNKLPTLPDTRVGPAWLHATPGGKEAASLPQQIESDKALASMFVPTSLPEAGLMVAMGPGGKAIGKLGSSVLGAGGIYGMATDEAQAGKLNTARNILRGAAAKEAWLGPDVEAKLASAKHPYSSVVGTPIRDMPAPSYRETVAFDRPEINFEQLKGGAFIPMPGDASIAGKQILGAGGLKFEHPVETYGGPDFARMMQTIGAPVPNNPNAFPVWQSMAGPMGSVANIARQVEAKGMQPWGLYVTGGKKYLDQATQMVETALEGAKASGLTQKQIDHVNKFMRETDQFSVDAIKDFPDLGLLKKGEGGLFDFYDKLLEYPMPVRSKLVKSMDSKEARNLGFPDMGALRVANTVPELLTTPSGSMGFTISKLDPSVGSFKSPYHPTYNTGVGGTEVYTLPGGVSVPPSEIVPTMHKTRQDVGGVVSKMYQAAPHKFYPAGPKGSDSSYEPITNEVLDRLQNYLRINPRGAAAIGGTVAGAAAALSPGEAEAGKFTPLPPMGSAVRGAAIPEKIGAKNWLLDFPTPGYHGTNQVFERFKNQPVDMQLDRALGTHVAADPALASSFADRFFPLPGSMRTEIKGAPNVIPVNIPPRKEFLQVDQPILQNYASSNEPMWRRVATDERQIERMMAKEGYQSDPAMLQRYLQQARAMQPREAEKAARTMAEGGQANVDIGKADLDRFLKNYGGRPYNQADRERMVEIARDVWEGKGHKGLRYINTAPVEAGAPGVVDPTSYIVFNPKNLVSRFGGSVLGAAVPGGVLGAGMLGELVRQDRYNSGGM